MLKFMYLNNRKGVISLNFQNQLNIVGAPLIKIKSTEIIKDLQKNGTIYMNKLGYYRDFEKKYGNTVIGDSDEGKIHVHSANITITETGETHQLNDTAIDCSVNDCFAYCMFFINPNNGDFLFSEQQKQELLSFGESALIVWNQPEFIKRIVNCARDLNLELFHKSVRYYSSNIDCANLWISLMDEIHNIAFWKRDLYNYQQEYRFLIKSDEIKKDHYILNIGDISDISEIIDTEKLLSCGFKKL